MRHTQIPALIFVAAIIVGCTPPGGPHYLTAYEQVVTRQAEDQALMQNEFNSRTISWSVPATLQDVAETAIKEGLRDPDSARFRFDFTTNSEDVTAVCGAINSRNGYGGYTGFQRFYVEIRYGKLSGSGVQSSSGAIRMIQNCGLTSDSSPSRSAVENQRPAETAAPITAPARRRSP